MNIKMLVLSLVIPYVTLLWALLVTSIMTQTTDQVDVMDWFVFSYSILAVMIFNHRHSGSLSLALGCRGIVLGTFQSCLCRLYVQCLPYRCMARKLLIHLFQHSFICCHPFKCIKQRRRFYLYPQMAVGLLSPIHQFITKFTCPLFKMSIHMQTIFLFQPNWLLLDELFVHCQWTSIDNKMFFTVRGKTKKDRQMQRR